MARYSHADWGRGGKKGSRHKAPTQAPKAFNPVSNSLFSPLLTIIFQSACRNAAKRMASSIDGDMVIANFLQGECQVSASLRFATRLPFCPIYCAPVRHERAKGHPYYKRSNNLNNYYEYKQLILK